MLYYILCYRFQKGALRSPWRKDKNQEPLVLGSSCLKKLRISPVRQHWMDCIINNTYQGEYSNYWQCHSNLRCTDAPKNIAWFISRSLCDFASNQSDRPTFRSLCTRSKLTWCFRLAQLYHRLKWNENERPRIQLHVVSKIYYCGGCSDISYLFPPFVDWSRLIQRVFLSRAFGLWVAVLSRGIKV